MLKHNENTLKYLKIVMVLSFKERKLVCSIFLRSYFSVRDERFY